MLNYRMTAISFVKQLYKALGLERWILNAEEIESISKAKHDKDSFDLCSNETKTVAISYNTWLVSKIFF